MTLPMIDPVAFTVFGWPIRWYGLMYLLGIWLSWLFVRRLIKRFFAPLQPESLDDFVPWAVLGILIGGRLGYVLFYRLSYYIYNPLQIFATWQGGMAFHGGLIGVGFALLWYVQKRSLPLLRFADALSVGAPIGIFFGRLGNFINQEIPGHPTASSWGVVFPLVDDIPRHPSQLYEAFAEGLFLFILLRVLTPFLALYRGALTSVFLMGYAFLRMVCEFLRIPDATYNLGIVHVTQGQLLSLPMFIAGAVLFALSFRRT